MNLQLMVVVIFIILVIPLIKRIIDKINGKAIKASNPGDTPEMEKLFIDKIKAGSPSLRIANIYGEMDSMFIKSLFQSEQIPYFFEFENTSSLRMGLELSDYNKTILNVLEDDYDDAIKVLTEYKTGKNTIEIIERDTGNEKTTMKR